MFFVWDLPSAWGLLFGLVWHFAIFEEYLAFHDEYLSLLLSHFVDDFSLLLDVGLTSPLCNVPKYDSHDSRYTSEEVCNDVDAAARRSCARLRRSMESTR